MFFLHFKFLVELVVSAMPEMYVERTLEYVSRQVSSSHHVEFYLNWATKILTIHASKENLIKQQSLISIQDSLQRKYDALSKVCDFNKYTLKVLIEMGQANENGQDENGDGKSDSDENDDEDEDEDDIDDTNLILIRQDRNGTQDQDVEMQTDSEQSSDDMSTDDG